MLDAGLEQATLKLTVAKKMTIYDKSDRRFMVVTLKGLNVDQNEKLIELNNC
ncbi:hypothetical protein GM3708_288 [Geminocystis sp. NIES-3708]|nr:hypothetical protein GM3708_288 [Geminocystis sp. NIES-3708]